MKKFFCALLLAAFFCTAIFAAPKVTIKIATILPENTDWGKALNQMAREWSEATNGEVVVRIYHNGVMGSELDIYRKIKGDQLQGAVFSTAGLSLVSKKILTVSMPFFIRNDGELDYVLKNMGGDLEQLIGSNNFKLIAWSKVGWIKFFAKVPVYTPSDLQKLKIASDSSLASLNEAMKILGYNVVSIDYNNILTSLNSGTTTALFNIPVYVAAQQLFGVANNMCSIDAAPVIGGIVVSESAWRKIPDKYKTRLLEIGKRRGVENDTAAAKLEAFAIDTMKKNGLTVNEVNAAQEKEWDKEMEQAIPDLTGGNNPVFDKALHTKIQDLLRQYRQNQ
jgi:TRAP-type C4-dicarboxylate transport system substrate-binding protein